MHYLKYLAVVGTLLLVAAAAPAQVAVGVQVGSDYYDYDDLGPPPECVYGYYSYYPYACAPYGYYGPDYFLGGIFIGAGPWYNYYGHSYYGRGDYGRGYYPRRGHGYGHGFYGGRG